MAMYDKKQRFTNSNRDWAAHDRGNRDFAKSTQVYNKRTGRRYRLDSIGMDIVRKNEARETRSKAFLAILFIVLFTVFTGTISSIPEPTIEQTSSIQGNQEYIASISGDVGTIATDSIGIVLSIIEPIAKTVEIIVRSFGSIVNSLLTFIGWFYEPIVDYDIRDTVDPTIICTSYDDLPLPQKINYTSSRLWHNLWNDPDIDTNEAFYIYIQQTRYGTEAYNEVCTS